MSDISREKILYLMWKNRSALVNADIHSQAIIAVDLYYTKLKAAIKSGRMDADPWIPVSTPPEEMVRVLGYSKETGDYYAVKYQGELLGWSMPGTCGISIDYYQYITPPKQRNSNEV